MSIFGMRHFAPCRSPEGEGGAGGGGGGLAGAAAAGAGQEPGTGGAGTSGGAWTPPEGIPTEFVGASADETLAKMLPAYTDVSKRADGLREKLSTMPKAPDSLDGYTFEPDDKLKPFFAGDLAQNPAWQHARQAAKDAGLSPEQLSKFVSGVYGPMIDGGRASKAVEDAIASMQIKVGDASDKVETLSGGNQQKVVIAKWLLTAPDVILLNDPTRGIDVGTKQEIYRLMRELADAGKAILFYSTDYAELIGCCDRVSVMYDGRVVAELEGDELTEEAIVAASLNIDAGAAA